MNRKRLGAVGVVIALAAAVTAWIVLHRGGAAEAPYSGTVEGREADLGFQSAGRVDRILVDEGDAVTAGQVLAVLDTAELAARRAGAVAQAAAARAQLAELERGSRPEEVAQARAMAAAARERLANARRDLERVTPLQKSGVVSRQDLDRATTAAEVAGAQYDQAQQQLRLVTTGPRPERIEAQRALLRQAEAAVAQLDATLANAVVRAPFPGVVTIRHREPGETLSPGLPVVTVLNPADRWVRIYVPEGEVGRLKLGEPARIASDAFPSRRYPGRITFIASQAEFTPKNVQTTEERTKLVYAVKVAITGDPARDLKPGIPADVALGAP
ncbi:MAG TPA: efflux RND transporter periplasmic adaptor subunit [Longimicrobiales bacterium]|nr:efflux RND transporter periplasmic adaptor subunit [Longimicrobiales bacterium]